MAAYERREVITCERWSHKGGFNYIDLTESILQLVFGKVVDGRRLLSRGGRTGKFDCIQLDFQNVIGAILLLFENP